jgi:hypothetical protein
VKILFLKKYFPFYLQFQKLYLPLPSSTVNNIRKKTDDRRYKIRDKTTESKGQNLNLGKSFAGMENLKFFMPRNLFVLSILLLSLSLSCIYTASRASLSASAERYSFFPKVVFPCGKFSIFFTSSFPDSGLIAYLLKSIYHKFKLNYIILKF